MVRERLQPCCLRCCHVFSISLFLGAMTSSPVILDTTIVRHPWKDWAWHCRAPLMSQVRRAGRSAGPNLTWVGVCGQVSLRGTLLPLVTLRAGLTDPHWGAQCSKFQLASTHTVLWAGTPRLCPLGFLLVGGGRPCSRKAAWDREGRGDPTRAQGRLHGGAAGGR